MLGSPGGGAAAASASGGVSSFFEPERLPPRSAMAYSRPGNAIIDVTARTTIYFADHHEVGPARPERQAHECGLSASLRKDLLALSRRTWSTLVERLPADIIPFLPRAVPIFVFPRDPITPPRGHVRFGFDRRQAVVRQYVMQGREQIQIVSYPLPDMRGVVLEIAPDDLDPAIVIEELLTHEFLHVLLHPGLAGNPAFAESLVERFTSEWYTPSSATSELRSLPWDWGRLWGSCGFRIDSFAHYQSSPSFETAYIVGSRGDLCLLPEGELWSVVIAALQSAWASHTTPDFVRVLEIGREVASAATIDGMLTSFAGRPMGTGIQGFLLPSGEGRAHFVAFRVSANPDYRVLVDPGEPLGWNNCQVLLEDADIRLRMELSDGSKEADVSVSIPGHAVVDVDRIVQQLIERGVWIASSARRVRLSGVFLGKTFELIGGRERMTPAGGATPPTCGTVDTSFAVCGF